MSDIGLFYVGAVLIINGIMLLGAMTPEPQLRSICSSAPCRSSPPPSWS